MRYPSIACTAEKFDRLLMWMRITHHEGRSPSYEEVDWENARPEDMEQWRQKFAEMQRALKTKTA